MKKSLSISIVWQVLVALLLVGLALVICLPNFAHSGPGKMSRIIGNLRSLQGAKEQWAYENHETNDVALNREALEPMFGPRGQGGAIRPVADERYIVSTLWSPAEAELTKAVEGYPAGTRVRLDTNMHVQFIRPNK